MSRRSAFVISLLLAVAASAGAYAVLSTAALRSAASKPQVAGSRDLARRTKQLDAWAASLARAERSRPPALPAVPRYAPVPTPKAAALGSLPALTAAPRRAAVAVAHPARRSRVAASAPQVAGAGSGRFPSEPAAPAAPPPASTPPSAAPAPAAVLSAPAPGTTTTTSSHHSDDGGNDAGTDD